MFIKVVALDGGKKWSGVLQEADLKQLKWERERERVKEVTNERYDESYWNIKGSYWKRER